MLKVLSKRPGLMDYTIRSTSHDWCSLSHCPFGQKSVHELFVDCLSWSQLGNEWLIFAQW